VTSAENPIRWDQLTQRRACSAHRTDGRKCKAYAMTGMDVCMWHGGLSAKDRNKKALALQVFAEFTNTYGVPVDVTPEDALVQEIARTNGHILWLQAQILTEDPQEFAASAWLYRRSVDSHIQWDEETRKFAGEAYSGVYLELYMKERQHLAKLCQIALTAGVSKRWVALAEKQADQVGEAMMLLIRKLISLGLLTAAEDHPSVRDAARTALLHASGQLVIEGETDAGESTMGPDGSQAHNEAGV